jgi:hypothetical protein
VTPELALEITLPMGLASGKGYLLMKKCLPLNAQESYDDTNHFIDARIVETEIDRPHVLFF